MNHRRSESLVPLVLFAKMASHELYNYKKSAELF
jgi:hypothetical protein